MYEQAIEIYKKRFGENSEQVSEIYLKLLPLYLKSGIVEKAYNCIDFIILNLESDVFLREFI